MNNPLNSLVYTRYSPQVFQLYCKTFFNENFNTMKYTRAWEDGRVFVSGGLFPRLYYGKPVRDIDIYCSDELAFNELYSYFIQEFSAANISSERAMQGNQFRKLVTRNFEIDLIGFHNPKNRTYPFHSFDFTICRFVYDKDGLTFAVEDWQDLINKKLVYTGNLGVRSRNNNSYRRITKYEQLGFTISALDRDRIIEHRESQPQLTDADSQY